MRVSSISAPITKGLKFIPWAMPNLRLLQIISSLPTSQNKRGFKKILSIQIIEERINLQRGFLPQNSTATGKTFYCSKEKT